MCVGARMCVCLLVLECVYMIFYLVGPFPNRFETASNPQDVRDYNDCITHENLRVAVCSMVDDSR